MATRKKFQTSINALTVREAIVHLTGEVSYEGYMFPHRWPKSAFVGGDPVLDFLNTVDSAGRQDAQNRLISYSSALAWAEAAGMINATEHKEIAELASVATDDAERALNKLVEWREAVYRVFETIAQNQSSSDDWKTVETSIKKAIADAVLSRDKAGVTSWRAPPGTNDLTTLPQRLALRLHDLLAGSLVANLKQCEGCTWLFIDTSKNYRRRWCSMATCGNRAKAQRHCLTKADKMQFIVPIKALGSHSSNHSSSTPRSWGRH